MKNYIRQAVVLGIVVFVVVPLCLPGVALLYWRTRNHE